MGAVKSLLYAVYMEHGVDAFVEKAKQLEVDEERQEEIYVEVEEAVEDLYDTPEGQEYKKLLEEKQQGVAHRAARYYRFDKKIYNKIRR